MSQTVTLTLPRQPFPTDQARGTGDQPVEELLIHALQASLPPLEGLLKDLIENLPTLMLVTADCSFET